MKRGRTKPAAEGFAWQCRECRVHLHYCECEKKKKKEFKLF